MEAQSYQKTKNNDRKLLYINNNPKCEWIDFTNKEAGSSRLGKTNKQTKSTLCQLQKTHLSYKDKYRLKVKVWKMILQVNGIHRKTGVAIFISDKIDLR